MKPPSLIIFAIFSVACCFGGDTSEFYSLLGTSQTIPCGSFYSTGRNITWTLNRKPITANEEYDVSPDRLIIKNVTEDKLGEYICENNIRGSGLIYSDFHRMYLKLAKAPQPEPHYQYSIHGTFNKTITIWCRVTAAPPANFTWSRDGKNVSQLRAAKYNVTSHHTYSYDESILQFQLSNNHDYGVYACEAINDVAYLRQNFTIEKLPIPLVEVKGFHNGALQLNIKVHNPPAEFSGYRARYLKWTDPNEPVWINTDFPPGSDIYLVKGLESDTAYQIQVGACVAWTRCAFNDTMSVYTTETPSQTSSSISIYSHNIQVFILPSLFTVNYLRSFIIS